MPSRRTKAVNAPPVAGVPPRTNNLTLYYERNGLNVRVARQYTARHVVNTSTGLNVPGGAYAYTTPRAQVDLSVGMNLKQMFNFAYNTDLTLERVEREQGHQPDLHPVQQRGVSTSTSRAPATPCPCAPRSDALATR
jgi:hypothetical protein